MQLVVYKLTQYPFNISCFRLQGGEHIHGAQHSETDVLRRDQSIVVKERYLDASPANIGYRASFTYELVKSRTLYGRGLVVKEPLL